MSKATAEIKLTYSQEKMCVERFCALRKEMESLFRKCYDEEKHSDDVQTQAMIAMKHAGRKMKELHPELSEELIYDIDCNLGFGFFDRDRNEVYAEINRIYFGQQ